MKSRIKPAEQQRVLLAYRDVIVEKDAHVWTNKAIRNLVLQHWSSKKSLVGGCGVNKVVYILKAFFKDETCRPEAQVSKQIPNLLSRLTPHGCKVEQGKALDTAIGAPGKRSFSLEQQVKTEFEGIKDDSEHQGRCTVSSMLLSIRLHKIG
jgi:hypothetical protein